MAVVGVAGESAQVMMVLGHLGLCALVAALYGGSRPSSCSRDHHHCARRQYQQLPGLGVAVLGEMGHRLSSLWFPLPSKPRVCQYWHYLPFDTSLLLHRLFLASGSCVGATRNVRHGGIHWYPDVMCLFWSQVRVPASSSRPSIRIQIGPRRFQD